jgi:hypothetical protein
MYRNGKKQIEIPIKITSFDVVNARGIILAIKEQKFAGNNLFGKRYFCSQALNVTN